MMESFTMKYLNKETSNIATNGSAIRLLADIESGGLSHCTLPPHLK